MFYKFLTKRGCSYEVTCVVPITLGNKKKTRKNRKIFKGPIKLLSGKVIYLNQLLKS